jgi:hypothetical protein
VALDPPFADEPGDSVRRQDDLVLLTTPAVRARRHPRALAGMWAWETVLALLVAWPAAGLARAAWSGDAHGDAAIWTPGGHELLDWLWHDAHGLSALTHQAGLVLVIGAVAGLVPMTALLLALAYATRDRKAPGLGRCIAGGLSAFPAMVLLLVLVTLLQGLVVGAGAVVASAIEGWTHARLGEARAQQLEGAVLLVFLGLASVLGVIHDLARAAVVRFKVKGLRAFRLGARTMRLSLLTLWWSWAWRAIAAMAPVLAVAAAAGALGGRGGLALVFLAVLHQGVVGVRVALRASWLARALRAVDDALRRVRSTGEARPRA